MTSAFTDKLYPDIANVLANENDGNDISKAKITALKRLNLSSVTPPVAMTALEVASVVILTTGLRISISITLPSNGLSLGLGSVVFRKTLTESNDRKTRQIKTLAESKLD